MSIIAAIGIFLAVAAVVIGLYLAERSEVSRYREYLASEWRTRAENEQTQNRQYYCYWVAGMIERAATIDDAARIDAEARKELKL